MVVGARRARAGALDLGGAFADPIAVVTARIRFATPEPTGPFDLWFAGDRGTVHASGERAVGQAVVVLQAGLERGRTYRPRLSFRDVGYEHEPVTAAADTTLDLDVVEWTAAILRVEGETAAAVQSRLRIEPRARGVHVRDAGDGTLRVFNLPPGTYRVDMPLTKGRPWAQPVRLTVGGAESPPATATLVCRRCELHTARIGVFHYLASAGDIVVEHDGAVVATLPLAQGARWTKVELPPGSYVVTARFPGFVAQQRLDLFEDGAELRFQQ